MKLFQYAILWHPNEEEKKTGKQSKVVSDIDSVLAPDQDKALMLAARQIPEEYLPIITQVEIAIRPF